MLLDQETLLKSSQLDPEILEFVQANPQPPLDWEDWQGVRAALKAVGQQGLDLIGPPEEGLVEEYKDIPMRDGFQSTIKIHRPAQTPASGSPLIIFYFGGGFISGDLDQNSGLARAWVRLFGATVVCPNYRLAPEHKFPISQNDAWDTVKWLDEHAHEIGADPKKGFVVGGVSAGAVNTAAIAAHAIENQLKHPITGQYLCVPSIMPLEAVPEKYKPYYLSHEQNKDVPILPESALDSLAKHADFDLKSPWRHPVYSNAPISKLPAAYLQIDGMDPLRDEGLIWEEMLKEASVKTRIDFYPGCPHAHFAFLPGLKVTERAIADQMVGIGWLLGRSIAPEEGLAAVAPRPSQ